MVPKIPQQIGYGIKNKIETRVFKVAFISLNSSWMEEKLLLSPYGSFGYKKSDCENQAYINIFAVPHNRFLQLKIWYHWNIHILTFKCETINISLSPIVYSSNKTHDILMLFS